MNYLCGLCRSNDCIHIDPRLKQQMLDRYLRDRGREMMAPHSAHIYVAQEPDNKKSKLLLLGRRK